MAVHQTQLQAFIAEEAGKVRGVAYPVRAGRLERALVRKVNCSRLHPNPHDEFCFPDVGPKESIIQQYAKDYRKLREDSAASLFLKSNVREPIFIQKIHPEGYMILNGHHRWIAAMRAGIRRLPVRIVNLTQESDIRKMLEKSKHDKRVTLDLEEIVFSGSGDPPEKPLSFPARLVYREWLRQGIPALFSFFAVRGYDIWLYSSGYDSLDYVRELLKLYHTQVTGIITGTARKAPKDEKTRETLAALMAARYTRTVHVDNRMLVRIDSSTREFREYPLAGSVSWAAEVMEALDRTEQDA